MSLVQTQISTCAVQVSPVRVRHQHPGDDGINAHIPAYALSESITYLKR